MKLAGFIFVFLYCTLLYSQVDTTFTELRGMEDSQGNTHLFYRKHSLNQGVDYHVEYNDIYHLNLAAQVDTLFLRDYFIQNTFQWEARSTNVYEFWNNNPATWISCGEYTLVDPDAYISRYDSTYVYIYLGLMPFLAISRQNPDLLYAFHDWGSGLLKSTDAGYTWEADSLAPLDVVPFSLSPFNDLVLFGRKNDYGYPLMKSVDGGRSYVLVDSSVSWYDGQFHYDADGSHIYAINRSFQNRFIVSPNGGDFWQDVIVRDAPLQLSVDPSQPGKFYFSIDDSVFISTDFGGTFSLYWVLNRPVMGLYLKPGTDTLYAATTKDIYRVTPRDTVSLKHLSESPNDIDTPPTTLAKSFRLFQNYPNPFNPATSIPYYLPVGGEVRLEIFNVLGQKIRTLVDQRQPAGNYTVRWDGTADNGQKAPGGMYFYRLKVGNYIAVKKMLLLP